MGHHRRRRRGISETGEEIQKGPWKAEEDEVLMKHVNKYGPRDWSSIRSKGLLQRTGKSCRLRWMNKLRPNLKNGVKFSAEEERLLIELQGQLGNKWATIATYLPGRTDNDVKNFWSSRQKRLARLLKTPSSKSHNSWEVSIVPTEMEASKFSSSSTEEESSRKSQSLTSQMIKIEPLSDEENPNSLNYRDQNILDQLDFHPAKENPIHDSHLQFPFPPIPGLHPDFPPALGNEVPAVNFLDVFGYDDASDLGNVAQIPLLPPDFGPCLGGNCQSCGRGGIENPAIFPDGNFSDFPADLFDQMEPIPSP